MRKKLKQTIKNQKPYDIGICFEALEPRLLLSGSWGTGADGPSPDSQSNSLTRLGPEMVTLSENPDTFYSDALSKNQLSLGIGTFVDVLANTPVLSGFQADNAAGPGSETPSLLNQTPPATDDSPTNGTASNSEPQCDMMDTTEKHELVIVNDNVADYEKLLADLQWADDNRIIEVVVLESDRNGIEQVSELLSERSGLAAVHVISHGAEGQINLGNNWLNSTILQKNIDAVSSWGNALTETGDILFYGCNIAADTDGQSLLDNIAELTGAEVAASDDLTGNSGQGGDWDLEYSRGKVETNLAISSSTQSTWSGVLLPFTVSNTADLGPGSLRQAILDANANVGVTDTISFNIGSGPQTIAVGSAGLPIITDSVILDATTQPGYSGTPLITLDGSATPPLSGINGINLRANNCTVKGFIVINFADEGIEMDGSTGFGDNNIIQNNWVGIDAAGNVAGNAEHGIMISADASGNQIGGTGPNQGNVTAGNGYSGVIINENSDNNIVEGNIIGLKPDGTTPAGNGTHGVLIQLSSDGNRIGGTTAGAGNVIAGNTQDGIFIDGTTDATYTTIPTGTVIQGNWIGTTGTGSTGVGNGNTGINVEGANTIIGGTGVNDGNVITNNDNEGINVAGTGATGTFIQGNIIGLDPDGSTKSGNGDVGIALLSGADDTTIGGTTAAARNVISNNVEGIEINSNNNIIQGNYIGTDAGGALNCGNHSDDGVEIKDGATGNLIGGEVAGAGNIIAFNALNGVTVVSGTGNAIVRNSIHSNTLLGINLGAAGVTANDLPVNMDSDTGANNLQNYPVLTSAVITGSQITITGTLNSTASTNFRIEFYANATGDGAGYGEGQTLIGVQDVTTDGSGNATIAAVLPVALWAGSAISATASRLDAGDAPIETSEFAQNVVATAENGLWISADQDSIPPTVDAGADGLPGGWKEGEVLQFGGPDLNLGAATDGDFSSVIDFDIFINSGASGTGDPGALHFVSRALTIGSGANQFNLQIGDVLVSFNQDETILAAYYETGTDTTVHMNDLLAFRPDTPGDYTSGTFYMVLNGVPDPLGAPINSLHAISLVEQDTYVGNTLLEAGSFIFSEQDGLAPNTPNHIYHFTATDAGQAAAAGTSQILIDGNDINIEVGSNIRGLDLIEKPITIGGMTFDSGDILVTLSIDDAAVGDAPSLNTSTSDIFVLKVTQSEPEPGNTTAATAEMVLDGSLVNFDGTDSERVYAISVIPDNFGPAVGGDTIGSVTEDVGVVAGNISDSGALTITDPDAGESFFVPETIAGTYGSLTIDAAGAWTYTADNSQAAIQSLGSGESLSDVLMVTTVDGTTQRITITINGANDAPTVANPIADQGATEDAAFTFQFAANTFNDVDTGDSLTYTASGLPAWLSFDAVTRTFTGTPINADVGTVTVTVRATDTSAAWVEDQFDITVTNTNDAPTVANPIADQGATEDAAFSFQFAANTFNDVDTGDSLTYTASGLPAWLSFDAVTRTFTGTPINADVGTVTVTVRATDTSAAWVEDQFDITVTNTNDAPTVANPIADQGATEDALFNFTFAANTFADVDTGDSLTYTASGLPAWLSFDAVTRTFTGTPVNADVGTVTITVRATDTSAAWVEDQFDITVTNTNDTPTVANPIADQGATEDALFNFTFAANTFADVDTGDSLTYTASGLPAWLSFDAVTRTFTGTPINADVGTLTVTVRATDTSAAWVEDQFDITVTNTNDAPTVANPIADQGATEDAAFTFQFAANTFNDVDTGDTLTYTASGLPAWLSFDAVTRTFTGTPVNADVGTVTITVRATDGSAAFVEDQFDITVSNVNNAPTVANPIADQGATEDALFSFTFAANTFNDVDTGDSLTYTASGLPAWLSFDAVTRTFTGTPINADVGTVTITVRATDTSAAFVEDQFDITVTNTNDTPTVANPIADQGATEDAAFTFQFAANTFNDVDTGDTLTYTASGLPAWLSFDGATRTFTGTPANADVGTVTITVRATDTSAAWVEDQFDITVTNTNDAPTVANPIVDQGATEDALFNFQFAANTFADVDTGDSLTYTASGLPAWLSFDAVTRTFTGTPINADVGTVTITVRATDTSAAFVEDQFDITVTNTNDAPTVANPIADQGATEDAAFTFQFAANTFNDVDTGDTLTYTASGLPAWLSFDGATRTFTGTPANADVGTVTITVRATDTSAAWVEDQFDITVTNTNDAPTVANPIVDQGATEDALFNFQFAANTFADVDTGDSLTYTASGLPAWLSFDAVTRTFTGTPINADVGTVTITVRATDTSAAFVEDQFDITVTNTNDTPTVANPIADQGATEDAAFTFQFAANTFNDVDTGDTLTYTASGLPAWLSFDGATRTFTGTPANADVGTVTITVRATDTSAAWVEDQFDITVANTNDAPTVANPIVDQGATEDALFNFQFAANTFADVDTGDSLTYTASGLPAWLSFDAVTRTFTGTPVNADVGTVTITVRATDTSAAWVEDQFDITVTNTNDTPTVANPIADQGATEDAAFTFQFAANTFNDVDTGDTLTYTASGLPAWLSFDGATRTFTGTPANADVGTVTITVRATDTSAAWVEDQFDITVTNTNDAPTVANPIVDQGATEDALFNFQFAANTFADVDTGDSLTYTASGLPAWLSFDAVTRTFTGTPVNADVGTVTITVRATDTSAAWVEDQFDITVTNTNDTPTVANPIVDQGATEDAAFTFQFAANTFNDVDTGDTLTYTASGLPAWLSFDGATRTFTGTPANADVGTVTITVRATDTSAAWVEDQFDITVANTNDAPTVANPIVDQGATEDALFNFQFAANTFADVDTGDSLTYTASGLPAWLSFDAVTRTFTGTPVNADVGTVTITVRATDTSAAWVEDQFDITVANANDAPVARPDSVHLSFDGDDFVQVADHPSLQMTNNVTMEAWINHSGSGTGTQIILNKEGEYEMAITADTGEIKWAIADTLPTWSWHNTGHFVTPGEWTHVAVTYDGVAGEVKTYINGTLVETFAQSGPIGDVYTLYDDLYIGGRENAVTQRFDGQIDEVRVWNTTRTQGEIQANMNSLVTGAELGLAGNWRLDEGSGGIAVDQSPFSNSGALGGIEGPSAVPAYEGYYTNEDSLLTVPAISGVLANDFDADGDPLTVTNLDDSGMLGTLALNPVDGSFTYDPRGIFDYLDAGEHVIETFTYTANDGSGNSNTATVAITVIGANDAPTTSTVTLAAIGEDSGMRTITQAELLANANDVDGDLLTATGLAISGGNGTLIDNGDGTWNYTPAANDDTAVSFSYSITDGTVTVAGSATLDMTPVNDAPTGLVTIDNMTPAEGDTLTSNNTLVDADGLSGPIGYQWYLDGVAIGGETGTTYTTVPADVGGVITVVASYTDDQGTFESVTSAATAAVTSVNNLPVIGGVTAGAVTEDVDPDTDGLLEAGGVLTVSDPDAGESSFQAGTVVGSYGTLTIDAAGNWNYAADNTHAAIQQLNAGENLTDVLTVSTADGTTHNVTISINGADDSPLADDSPGPVDEGGTDPDPEDDGDPIEPDPDEVPPTDDELPPPEEPGIHNLHPPDTPPQWTPARHFVSANALRTIGNVNISPSITARYISSIRIEPTEGSLESRIEGNFIPAATVFFSPEIMAQALDHLQRQIDDTLALEANQGQLIIGAAAGIGASVMIGYVLWAFRGASLLLGALSAMPMWRSFDPLPVLLENDKERDEEDDEKRVRDILDAK